MRQIQYHVTLHARVLASSVDDDAAEEHVSADRVTVSARNRECAIAQAALESRLWTNYQDGLVTIEDVSVEAGGKAE
jgi:hypothetical protein